MSSENAITVTFETAEKELEYEQTPVLKYTYSYPLLSSNRYYMSTERINRHHNYQIQRFMRYAELQLMSAAIADYRSNRANDLPIHMYEANLIYQVPFNQGCVLSLYSDGYQYTGGAHGNTTRVSETWDVRRGRLIKLPELFPENSTYLNEIQAEINRQIAVIQNENGTAFFEDYPQLVRTAFDPEAFYLSDEGVVIYFQQYSIGPYASGIPEFVIPYQLINVQLPDCL